MAIKVYLNENYLIVENGNVYGEGLAKDVRVNRLYVEVPEDGIQKYSFTNVNNISEQFAFRDAPDGDVLILDENGDPYANEAAFETFYLANTGKPNGGATPITLQDVLDYLANNEIQIGQVSTPLVVASNVDFIDAFETGFTARLGAISLTQNRYVNLGDADGIVSITP